MNPELLMDPLLPKKKRIGAIKLAGLQVSQLALLRGSVHRNSSDDHQALQYGFLGQGNRAMHSPVHWLVVGAVTAPLGAANTRDLGSQALCTSAGHRLLLAFLSPHG